MRRALLLGVLLAAAPLAGCAQSAPLQRLTGQDAAAPEPFYREVRADVGPGHEARHPFEVGARAVEVNVTLALATRTHGLPGADAGATPAMVTVALLAPSGAVVASQRVDPQHPDARLLARDPAERGTYVVHVAGTGVSETLQGEAYGASYLLTIEVLHA